MKRSIETVPGWDCIRAPCGRNGCGVHPGSNHGIHNDEWVYIVSEGDFALVLSVYSRIYPATVPEDVVQRAKERDGLIASDLTMHVGFRYDREQVMSDYRGRACAYVAGGRCYGGSSEFTSVSQADALARAHHDRVNREQGEAFWQALEAKLREWRDSTPLERADARWQRCVHCDATGTILKG